MRVCFLTDDPQSFGGGPEHIAHVASLLRRKYNVTVDVVTPLTMDPKFDFHNFGQRIRFTFWTLKFLFTSDYDIYHSHTFSTSAFLPLVKLRGKKTGVTIHGAGKDLLGGGVLNKTFIPKFLGSLILGVWPFDFRLSAGRLKNFVAIGNGVDINEFANVRRSPHKNFTILCISRPDPVKGVAILKKVVRKLPWAKLHLVSGRRRMVRDFAGSDVYVLPSLSEGFPVALLEAMAARLPIVTTDVGDCRELVEKSRSGVVVPPGDANALAHTIAQMRARADLQKLGENGYNFVKDNYTWEKVAQKVYAAYQKVLNH